MEGPNDIRKEVVSGKIGADPVVGQLETDGLKDDVQAAKWYNSPPKVREDHFTSGHKDDREGAVKWNDNVPPTFKEDHFK